MAAGATYEPIQTTTLGSAAASYTFSSIPSTYTDLVLIINGKITITAEVPVIEFNGDTALNYSFTRLTGNGTTASSARSTGTALIPPTWNIYWNNANPGTAIMNIMNYANTTTYKTVLSRGSEAASSVQSVVGLWRNTAAITSIKVYGSGGNLDTGMILTLYGIAAA
jgi:hypothetical protein